MNQDKVIAAAAFLLCVLVGCAARQPRENDGVGQAAFNAALSACNKQGYVEPTADWEWCVRSTAKKMIDDYYGASKSLGAKSVTCERGFIRGTVTCTED